MDHLRTGMVLGHRYRLVAPVRAGRSDGAWRAVDETTDREVAVKALGAHAAGAAASMTRFRLLFRTAAELSFPGIAQVHDCGQLSLPGGLTVAYLVRELVRGRTLEDRLFDGLLRVDEALGIVASVADALAAAHRAGTVHGNLVPANVILGPAGVKITDFGLWLVRDQAPAENFESVLSYTAPELAAGEPATPATDMYSLGVIFVACMTGISAGGMVGASPVAGLPPGSGAAGLAALWAACLGASPRDRPSAAHAAVISRQMAAASEPMLADSAAAAKAPPPAGGRPADRPDRRAPGRRFARWPIWLERRPGQKWGGPVALGGAATGVTVAVLVVLAQFLASPAPRPSERPVVASSSSHPQSATAAAPSRSASHRAPSPDATSSVLAPARSATPLRMLDAISRAIHQAVVTGQIRPDVGLDFSNLIQPVREQLAAGGKAPVTALVTTLRGKLAQRAGEGAITTTMAGVLSRDLSRLLQVTGS